MPTIYDIRTDSRRECTQEDIDKLEELLQYLSHRPEVLRPDQSIGMHFKLALYPNRLNPGMVFVAEDKPIEPYSLAVGLRGEPLYPSTPNTPWAIGAHLDRDFAAELVRRWNAAEVGGIAK